MALLDNGVKLGTGVAIGIGALILAPTVIPVLASVVKPLIKATIKGGLMLVEKGKEIAAETQEVLEDLAAEAKAEIDRERTQAAAAMAEQAESATEAAFSPEQGSS